jgi:DNA polymerase-3 subunit epsilon
VLGRLGGVLEATHARPRLLLAAHPNRTEFECFWIAGGRLVDWGPLANRDELEVRTATAVTRAGRAGELGTHVPVDEIDELRILGSWLSAHPRTPQLPLRPAPGRPELEAFARRASAPEGELDDNPLELVTTDRDL